MECAKMEGTNIYFIGSLESGTVKIGKSNNPEKRLTELQTANPHKLVLYGVIDDVTPDLENTLHEILSDIRLKGEWFKLTDKLIQFMVSKTDKISYDYKINRSKTIHDSLDEAIEKTVKPNKNGKGWVSETDIIMVIRKYLIFKNESPHFDVETLKRKLKNRRIYRSKAGTEWIYLDHHVDEKVMHPDHYIGIASKILCDDTRRYWNKQWQNKSYLDSIKWPGIKFIPGYSYIIPNSEDSLNVTTIVTRVPKTGVNAVIYKNELYDASNIQIVMD